MTSGDYPSDTATDHVYSYATATSDQLAELQERLALVLQATHDGVWDWDLLTNRVYFSPRWRETTSSASTT